MRFQVLDEAMEILTNEEVSVEIEELENLVIEVARKLDCMKSRAQDRIQLAKQTRTTMRSVGELSYKLAKFNETLK